MKLQLTLAAASILALGLSGAAQTARAAPQLAAAFSAPAEHRLPVQNAGGGFDGYGFGLHGRGCGWGHGGGTGYDGCFVFERGSRGYNGYRGYNRSGKRYYRRGRSYRGDYGYRGGYGRGGRRY